MTSREDDVASEMRQTRRAYQRIAATWADLHESSYDHAFHERCRALFLEHLQGQRVLDVGCGLGLDSRAFAAAGLRVVAADVVIEFLRMFRAGTPRVPVAMMDMTAPCFRAGSFDGVYACASLLHVPPGLVPRTLAAMANMLAPDGVLFLHHVAGSGGLSSYRVDDLLIENNPAHCYCHRPRELAALLEAANLHVLAVSRVRPRAYPSRCPVRARLKPYQIIARK